MANAPAQKVRVSEKVAFSEAMQMRDENVSRTAQQVRAVEKHLRNNLELRMVLHAIFRMGANGVHRVSRLLEVIETHGDPAFAYDQFVSGLDKLRELGLYVQTGKSGEVVFAKDPMFSHVLGLICEHPSRYGKDPNFFGLFGQRSLPLTFV